MVLKQKNKEKTEEAEDPCGYLLFTIDKFAIK